MQLSRWHIFPSNDDHGMFGANEFISTENGSL